MDRHHPQDYSIDQTEDRSIRAYPQRKRHNRRRGEHWGSRQQANAVPAVAQEIAEPADGGLIAHRIGSLRDAACAETSLPGILTPAHRILFRHLQMEPEFLLRLAVIVMAEGFPPSPPPFPQTTAHPASPSSIACIIAVMRAHSAFSVWSCRRPAAVML